ncbi:hypothetical protein HanRHA438_Chr02g0065411 [Helianthus annuus]|nr:hypothetical protein HanRHA438_Chr02g0065411 [Helianthus annuus]
MSVQGGVRINTPQRLSGSHYPPLHEDPQMGGPSNPILEADSTPVAPPLGFDNPIPAYAGSAAYNPFEQPAHTNYNYADEILIRQRGTTTLFNLKGPMEVLGPLVTQLMGTSVRHLLNLCITNRRSRN